MRRALPILLVAVGALLLLDVGATAVWKEPLTAAIHETKKPQPGESFGRLSIPAIGIDVAVVKSTTADALKGGPGHFSDTALPGQGETVAIAGHRTTYGAPFRNIDELDEGDVLLVKRQGEEFRYEVTKKRIVDPGEVGILSGKGERLLLTTCHPVFSASQRLVVYARPVPIHEQWRRIVDHQIPAATAAPKKGSNG